MLSNSNQFPLADKKEVFEFHLEWLSLCVRCPNSASGEELSREMQAQFDDLALRMARFVVNRWHIAPREVFYQRTPPLYSFKVIDGTKVTILASACLIENQTCAVQS
jgi:hypothetical protein